MGALSKNWDKKEITILFPILDITREGLPESDTFRVEVGQPHQAVDSYKGYYHVSFTKEQVLKGYRQLIVKGKLRIEVTSGNHPPDDGYLFFDVVSQPSKRICISLQRKKLQLKFK